MSSEIVNIAAHLPAMAAAQPDALAIACPDRREADGYRHLSFRELDHLSDQLARGLVASGVERGVRTALLVTPGVDFFALTFALFKVGAVVVLVDPGIGRGNLGKCLTEAEPEAFIGIPKAQLGRLVFQWAQQTVKTVITVGRRFLWGGLTLEEIYARGTGDEPFPIAETTADETAAILFTSGSTGVPKGVVYSHGIFAAQVEMLRRIYDIEPGEIDLPTFPLFALFDPALGMSAVIPDMDFTRPGDVDPQKILEPIQRFEVTSMFGSPALIDRVGRYGSEHGVKLPSLRRVISAGAPVAPRVLERFSTMLAGDARIHTPYGATEALPVSTIDSETILTETRDKTDGGAGVCVGRPVEGMDVRVIEIRDERIEKWSDDLTLPEWEAGEIVVRGPVVTRSYYGRDAATALAKIAGPEPGELFHRMGDLGYFDTRGQLWFCGRKSQRVVTSRSELYTIPCEAVFNTHKAVARSALVGVDRGRGVEPVLCVELERPIDTKQLVADLLELGSARPHTSEIRTILIYKGRFPVDIRHNAKIFREKLAGWASKRLAK